MKWPTSPFRCPECRADLRGREVPAYEIQMAVQSNVVAYCGGVLVIQGVDNNIERGGPLHLCCPSCAYEWVTTRPTDLGMVQPVLDEYERRKRP